MSRLFFICMPFLFCSLTYGMEKSLAKEVESIKKYGIGADFYRGNEKFKFVLYSSKTNRYLEEPMCRPDLEKKYYKEGKFSLYLYSYADESYALQDEKIFEIFPTAVFPEDASNVIVYKDKLSDFILINQPVSCESDMWGVYRLDESLKITKVPFVGKGTEGFGFLSGHFMYMKNNCFITTQQRWCLNKNGVFKKEKYSR